MLPVNQGFAQNKVFPFQQVMSWWFREASTMILKLRDMAHVISRFQYLQNHQFRSESRLQEQSDRYVAKI
ncbi:hypothetical protein BAR24_09555 [Gluconobacter oxydans]|nr:hypothetical protein BAR24_09555 [Gluconobacter oxydans]